MTRKIQIIINFLLSKVQAYILFLRHRLRWTIKKNRIAFLEISEEYAIGLATYPARLKSLERTLQTLIMQKFESRIPIYVVVEKQDFPRYSNLKEKYSNYGIQFISNNREMRSFNKYFPATLKALTHIKYITADDDIIYPSNWVRTLVTLSQMYPNNIVGLRGCEVPSDPRNFQKYLMWKTVTETTAGNRIMLNSGAGILFPPGTLKDILKKEDVIKSHFASSDDIYLWYFLYGRGATFLCSKSIEIVNWPKSQSTSLWRDNVPGGGNDLTLRKLLQFDPKVTSISDGHYE